MEKVDTYHIHVYFDDDTETIAQGIYDEAQKEAVVLERGRFHPRPVGPHPCRQFQLKVSADDVESLVSWVDERRQGLTVLIHPLTDNDYLAHTEFARWLGTPRALHLDSLDGKEAV